MLELPGPDDVIAAHERIRGWVKRTPLLESASINAICKRRVLLKSEPLQSTGAFKARGAANHVRVLVGRGSAAPAGVVAASSGNHGRAVAWAAQRAGLRAAIVLPENAVPAKRAAVAAYGAELHTVGSDPAELAPASQALAGDRGWPDIPAFDHPLTIAGQGTCVLEAFSRTGDIEAVVTPIGGGGLTAGSALAIEALEAQAALIAVEPEGAADTHASFWPGGASRSGPRARWPMPCSLRSRGR